MAKTAAINMRVDPTQHDLLTRAAALQHKDRTTFILEAACREAENVLLDQRRFLLDDAAFEAFEAALSEPLPANTRLPALLQEAAPWEQ